MKEKKHFLYLSVEMADVTRAIEVLGFRRDLSTDIPRGVFVYFKKVRENSVVLSYGRNTVKVESFSMSMLAALLAELDGRVVVHSVAFVEELQAKAKAADAAKAKPSSDESAK